MLMELGSQGKNYYELLGVARAASRAQIKQAYRDIALVYHPDSHFFDEIVDARMSQSHAEMFKLMTNAYHTLINPATRAEYDNTLPPDLPKWKVEGERDDRWIEPKLEQTILRSAAGSRGTFGVFGRMGNEKRSAFEESDVKLFSIAELRKKSLSIRIRLALAAFAAGAGECWERCRRWWDKYLRPICALLNH